MKLLVAAVGRAGKRPEAALYAHFAARLRPPPVLVEVEERRPLPAADRRRREGEKLLAHIPEGAVLVALDERGDDLASRDLAARIGSWQDEGVPTLAFVIGGADGLDPEVVARARLVLAFGRATWPHLMVRAMLAEQLYRCRQILAGHPYHRD